MANTPVEVKTTTRAPAVPDAWRSFRMEMDRLFDRFNDGFGLPSMRGLFDAVPFRFDSAVTLPNPAIDVTEDAAAFKVTAELPGLSEKDVEVVLTDRTLTIKGEKKAEKTEKNENYYLSERSYGTFRRSFELPDGVDRDKIGAEFAKGVLVVTLPKMPAAMTEAKKIEVKAVA